MIENDHVRRDFQGILDRHPDVGVAKTISNWVFEPTNIFDPKPRQRTKPSVILVAIYAGLIAAVCAAFNFR